LRAAALRERLLDANITEVPQIVQEIKPFQRWADSRLRKAYSEAQAKGDFRRQLHASLALLPVDPYQVEYLYERLLDADPLEVPVIRDALVPHKESLTSKLWGVVEQPAKGKESQRLRAATALATYDPSSQRWLKVSGALADQIVAENLLVLGVWIEGLRPVRHSLLNSLATIFRDASRQGSERILAANILADYAADQPELLADLLMDADEKQFAVLYPKLTEHGERAAKRLLSEIGKEHRPLAEDDKEKLAKRQANAAVALLKMGTPEKVWPLLKHSSDPRVRSWIIHKLTLL
jgi:hypothetical protein